MATKGICQLFGHFAKLVYFGGLVSGAGVDPLMGGIAIACSVIGTSAARPVLERLTDTQYRTRTWYIITAVATFYICQGLYLLWRQGGF